MRTKTFCSAVGLVLVLLLLLDRARADPGALPNPAQDSSNSSISSAHSAQDKLAAPRLKDLHQLQVSPPGDAQAGHPGRAWDDEDVLIALQRLSATNLRDQPALESAALPFSSSPANLLRVVELLQGHGLNPNGQRISPLEQAALRLIALALAPRSLGHNKQVTSLESSLPARELLEAMLRALPHIFEPAQSFLIDLIRGCQDAAGRPILDMSHLVLIEELLAAYPLQSERWLALVEAPALRLVLEDGRRLGTHEWKAAQSPLRERRVAAMLGTASALFLHDDSSSALKAAISMAISQCAPVSQATAFLDDHSQPDFQDEFFALGQRDGASLEIAKRYCEQRIWGDDSHAKRLLLVYGMHQSAPDELLSIASEDPSMAVRTQAWLNLLYSPAFEPKPRILDALRACYANLNDPTSGLPDADIIQILGIYLQRTATDQEHPHGLAQDLLQEICSERKLGVRARAEALALMQTYAQPKH